MFSGELALKNNHYYYYYYVSITSIRGHNIKEDVCLKMFQIFDAIHYKNLTVLFLQYIVDTWLCAQDVKYLVCLHVHGSKDG